MNDGLLDSESDQPATLSFFRRKMSFFRRKMPFLGEKWYFQEKNVLFQEKNVLFQEKNVVFQEKNVIFQKKNDPWHRRGRHILAPSLNLAPSDPNDPATVPALPLIRRELLAPSISISLSLRPSCSPPGVFLSPLSLLFSFLSLSICLYPSPSPYIHPSM